MNGCCEDDVQAPAPPQAPVSWCAGNNTYTYANHRVTVTPRLPLIADGTYPNATITVVGGCLTAVAQGPNVVYSACDPCVVPPPPPTVAAVPIDGNACNLSTFSPIDGLLTQLITQNSSCLIFSGCGNSASPLTATPAISLDAGNALECRPNGLFVQDPSATVGVNFSGCGITITNGLWKTVPLPFAPILNLISSDGSMQLVQGAGDPCTWDLTVLATGDITQASQAFSFNTTADLPPTPTGSNGWAAIGAANPREVWMFIVGVGWRQLLDNGGLGCKVNF